MYNFKEKTFILDLETEKITPLEIIYLSETTFVAPGHERFYKFVIRDATMMQAAAAFTNVEIKIEYIGTNNDSYDYTYLGVYDSDEKGFLRTNEKFSDHK